MSRAEHVQLSSAALRAPKLQKTQGNSLNGVRDFTKKHANWMVCSDHLFYAIVQSTPCRCLTTLCGHEWGLPWELTPKISKMHLPHRVELWLRLKVPSSAVHVPAVVSCCLVAAAASLSVQLPAPSPKHLHTIPPQEKGMPCCFKVSNPDWRLSYRQA